MQTFKTTSILLFSFFISFNSTSFSKKNGDPEFNIFLFSLNLSWSLFMMTFAMEEINGTDQKPKLQ